MRMMRTLAAAAAATVTLYATVVAAEERCGDAADEALFSAKSWKELAVWFERYPECDDGYFAEHVSTLVGEWLSAGPEQLASLHRVVAKNASFMDHVARHIDTTLGEDTRSRIRHHAERKCPSRAARVCRRIIQALEEE